MRKPEKSSTRLLLTLVMIVLLSIMLVSSVAEEPQTSFVQIDGDHYTFQLAIPIMIQNLINTLVNTADYWAVLVISHYS